MIITQPSSIEIVSAKLTYNLGQQEELDITADFIYMEVKESIFAKYLTSTAKIKSNDNIFRYIEPVSGNCQFIIQIIDITQRDNNKYDLVFDVKGSSIENDPESSTNSVVLNLVEADAHLFMNEYSTSFNNKRISKFISEHSEIVLKRKLEFVEPTDNPTSLAMPYLRFDKMFSYLNQYMKSEKGYFKYLYYATLNGNYVETVPHMIQKQSLPDPFVQVKTSDDGKDYQYFIKYNETNANDRFDAINDGVLGSSKYEFDPDTKQMVETKVEYKKSIERMKHLGKHSVFPSDITNVKGKTYYAVHNTFKNEISMDYSSILYGNTMFIDDLDGLMTRRCGTVNTLMFNDFGDSTNTYDESYSGNYLIESITHKIYRGSYKQDITFSKDGKNLNSSNKQISLSVNNS